MKNITAHRMAKNLLSFQNKRIDVFPRLILKCRVVKMTKCW